MRYMVCINDDERRDNGDELSLEGVEDEVEELLRSGYFRVEYIDECRDNE